MSAPVGDPSHATEVVRELSGSTIGHKDQGPPGPLVFDLMDCPLSSPRHAYPCHTSNTRPWLHQSDQTMGTQDFPWQQRRPRNGPDLGLAVAPYPHSESQSISDRAADPTLETLTEARHGPLGGDSTCRGHPWTLIIGACLSTFQSWG
jgi:hypothetical protein